VRVVLDTNVFISGVFFRGAPHRVLQGWRDGRLEVLFSPAILGEYERVGKRLANQFPGIDLSPFLALLLTSGRLYRPHPLPQAVCADPQDDKFLACALAGRCRTIISGDNHLLTVTGYRGITVWRPRTFADRFLSSL
jgi:putative PIN family toxin of toxin-antitoxin system